jgi:hypothetical protein
MTLRSSGLALALAVLSVSCSTPIPPPDPTGHDLLKGVVVAATTSAEQTPGMRTYKVVHVDDYPEPIGWNLHLIAYDPKAPTFEEAQRIRQNGKMKVVSDHVEVRLVDFITRDHRIIAKESVSEEEMAGYIRARDHKGNELSPSMLKK